MRILKYTLVGLICSLVTISCAGLKQRVDYTQFGEANPTDESRVVEKFVHYVEVEKKVDKQIRVLADTFPDGASKKGDDVTMDPKLGTVIGKFKFKFLPWEQISSKKTAIAWTKQITRAAGGNMASVSFTKDYEDTTKLHGASGYIFKIVKSRRQKNR